MSTTQSSFNAHFLDRWSLLLATTNIVALLASPFVSLNALCFVFAMIGGAFFTVLMFHHSQRRMADWVTYLRILLAILFLLRGATGAPLNWTDPLFGLFILSLDGLDGYFARRQGPTYTGAVFDMEADGFFVTTLTMLAITLEKLPLWLLILPAWRYLYVVILSIRQQFRPMPIFKKGGWRGKIVCVLIQAVLIIDLMPPVPLEFKWFVSAMAALLLTASFLSDLWEDIPSRQPA